MLRCRYSSLLRCYTFKARLFVFYMNFLLHGAKVVLIHLGSGFGVSKNKLIVKIIYCNFLIFIQGVTE